MIANRCVWGGSNVVAGSYVRLSTWELSCVIPVCVRVCAHDSAGTGML